MCRLEIRCSATPASLRSLSVSRTSSRIDVALKIPSGWSLRSTTSVAYHVLPPLDQQLAAYGTFATTTAWYANTSDPFGRAPCVLAYNRQLQQQIGVHQPATNRSYEDNRIFNNGLSDEAGAGAHVGFYASSNGTPTADFMDIDWADYRAKPRH